MASKRKSQAVAPRGKRVTERRVVAIDTERLRARAVRDCAKAAKAFAQDDAALKDFEMGDAPAFERWKQVHLGPLLADYQRLREELAEAGTLYDIALYEAARRELPPWKALRLWREEQAQLREQREAGTFIEAADEEALDEDEDAFFGDFEEVSDDDFEEMDYFSSGGPGQRTQRARSGDGLRAVYRRLCQLLHPDVGGEMTPGRADLWHQVQEAYAAGDAVRLDTLLARVEQADGREIRPRTIAELLDLKRHYERSRQQLRVLLRSAQRHPAWKFRQMKAAALERLARRARAELQADMTFLRRQIQSLRRAVEPRPSSPKSRRTRSEPPSFGPDELSG